MFRKKMSVKLLNFQVLLPALFKLMPNEILKNPDSGAIYGQTMFAKLEWNQIKSK